MIGFIIFFFFFSSRRRHTRFKCDWSSDVVLFRSFHHRESDGIHATHLAGPDAESRAIAREDDGVGLHVLANFPGEAHVLHFFWRRRSLGDGAQLGFGDFAEVWLLNEHASGDALELKLAVRLEAAGRQFEEDRKSTR